MRLIAFLILLSLSPTLLLAQATDRSHHWLSPGLSEEITRSSTTKAGGAVVSFPCDPLMSAKQERAIAIALMKESPFQWRANMPISKIAEDLSELFLVMLDRRALEEIGLEVDTPIGAGVMVNGSRITSQRESKPARWWDRSEGVELHGRPSLIATLMNHLRNLDLTLMIVRGQVVLTTVEAAEEDLATRIYDVTPLVDMRHLASWGRSQSLPSNNEVYADFDTLVNLIETNVDPDTWEALGGNSTITGTTIRDRHWLVFSTTTMTHWKIQRLLDRLNH
ncbi:hypothetical protein [Stieleria mannarensis]|uniref:hypothetical protein n=1 Tax=Stieleria mannarensis TaxID=2755585 RepID=UPI0016029C5E|nr:hypothetical protein [Rhodopirellula sp. JC639]